MKRLVIVMLIALMAVSMLSACGGNSGGENGGSSSEGSSSGSSDVTSDIESAKTFGDLINLEPENIQWSMYDGKFIYAFEKEGEYYRAITDVTEEQQEAISAVDYSQENYREKENEVLSPIEIKSLEHLNDQMLSQEELDKLIGKTGQELFDDGWTGGDAYMFLDMEFWLNKGPFSYSVFFDGEIDPSRYEDFDPLVDLKDLTVKSAKFSSLGDATNIEGE